MTLSQGFRRTVHSQLHRPFVFSVSEGELPLVVERGVYRAIYTRSLRPGESTDEHLHPHRTEVILVLEGNVTCTLKKRARREVRTYTVSGTQSGIYIPPNTWHRISCDGRTLATLLVLATRRQDRKIIARPTS